jgi:hypothetical protein
MENESGRGNGATFQFLQRNVETVTLPFFGSSALSLLNDLKLCGSKGLAAVANRARLFGTADAYKVM